MKAIAYLHEIKEPGREPQQVLSLSMNNPWSGWLEEYLNQCIYKCTPLYTHEDKRAEIMKYALKQIASCEKHADGDVVDIARKALETRP